MSFIKDLLKWGVVRGSRDPVTGGIANISAGGAIIGQLSAITYNTNGTINTYLQDNVTWTCAYDSAGRLSTETASGGSVRTYTYDATTGLLSTVAVV